MGLSLRKVAYFVWYVSLVWGLIMNLAILGFVVGFWGVIFGIVLAPITLVVVPWYAVAVWGQWIPLVIPYGGAVMGAVLYTLSVARETPSSSNLA